MLSDEILDFCPTYKAQYRTWLYHTYFDFLPVVHGSISKGRIWLQTVFKDMEENTSSLCIGAWDMNFQFLISRSKAKSKIVTLCSGVASLSFTFFLQILFLFYAKCVFFKASMQLTSLYWLSRLVLLY